MGDQARAAGQINGAQEVHAGTDNITSDPLLVVDYYLSKTGLTGQDSDSPCIDAGSAVAGTYGLSGKTTRTDGTTEGATTVDRGYHYDDGSQSSASNLVLYVDAGVLGDDTNNGLTAGTPFKTLGKALEQAVRGCVIHVAAGAYDTGNETFPLTIQDTQVTIQGTNRATTIVRGDQTTRLIESANKVLTLSGLTLEDGKVTEANGGALYVQGGVLTITNCLFQDNQTYTSTIQDKKIYGGALYVDGAVVSIVDSEFRQNKSLAERTRTYAYGGALHQVDGSLSVAGCTFADNRNMGLNNCWQWFYGGAVSLVDVDSLFTNTLFVGNYCKPGGNRLAQPGQNRGGAVYMSGGSATIDLCTFTTNYLTGFGSTYLYGYGGSIYAEDVSSLAVRECGFSDSSILGTDPT
ncbi:DUF1565 domain-containing protein, partial [Verrucomicrobiota bacterium]